MHNPTMSFVTDQCFDFAQEKIISSKMTGFSALRDISNAFEHDLRKASSELFTAKAGDSYEDGISKKLRDIALFTSKLRLLRAKPLASTTQLDEEDKSNVLSQYEDAAVWAIIEQQTVKSLTQAHAVKSLLTAPARNLDPQMMERKLKIREQLLKYGQLETELRHLNTVLKEKHSEHATIQAQWDKELGMLRFMKASADDTEDIDLDGPLYQKLRTLIDKMELMRWMISKLVTARTGGYDWLTDPHRRFSALKMSREANTVESLMRD